MLIGVTEMTNQERLRARGAPSGGGTTNYYWLEGLLIENIKGAKMYSNTVRPTSTFIDLTTAKKESVQMRGGRLKTGSQGKNPTSGRKSH